MQKALVSGSLDHLLLLVVLLGLLVLLVVVLIAIILLVHVFTSSRGMQY